MSRGPALGTVLATLRLTVVALAVGALAVAAFGVPLPLVDLSSSSERAAAAQTSTTSPAGATELACPGPETIGVRGSTVTQVDTATQADTATPVLSVASAPSDLLVGDPAPGATISSELLPRGKAGSAKVTTGDVQRTLREPAAVAVRGVGSRARALTAEQTTVVTTGDLRGLSSVTCTTPAADTWLVGGGGEPGRRGRLVLANPAANPVQVRVDVLSATGRVAATPGSTVAVPARSRLVLLLDALAPGVASPVVHVRATGGAVTATLHDARLVGTTARGTDDVAPAAAPARRVLVPGLTINGRALLRLAVPGSTDAVGEVRLFGPTGPVDPPGGPAVRVPAGGTRDIDLSALPAGTYGVQVSADVPLVAGAMVERSSSTNSGSTGTADHAWLASSLPLRAITGLAGVSSQPPWSTTLALTAPGRADAVVDLTTVAIGGSRQTQTLRVPAGTSTITVLPSAQSAWLQVVRGSGEVVAARTTTYLDGVGRLITAGSLTDLPTSEVVPVVRPAG